MSRLPRLHVPGGFYHVTSRGNHRQNIFHKRADRQTLDEIMAKALEHTGARVHAYCWMSNHVHLLVQAGDRPLGVLMQRVGTTFARLIQKGLATTGHLFENRYHALLIDADSYFLELVRYIHLNPVRAGIVSSPEQYRWSSHRVYLGKAEQPWVHTEFALRFFGADLDRARQRYSVFIHDRIDQPRPAIPIDAHPKERRVLGDDRFLQTLTIPVLRRHPTTTLDRIVEDVCREFGITLDQLRSTSQARLLCKARALIARRTIEEHVGSLSDAARFLNRSAAALARGVARYSP